jgi:hypothetical protein
VAEAMCDATTGGMPHEYTGNTHTMRVVSPSAAFQSVSCRMAVTLSLSDCASLSATRRLLPHPEKQAIMDANLAIFHIMHNSVLAKTS